MQVEGVGCRRMNGRMRCAGAAVRSPITVAQVVRSGRRLRPILRAPRSQARTSVYHTRRDASARQLTPPLPVCTCWNAAAGPKDDCSVGLRSGGLRRLFRHPVRKETLRTPRARLVPIENFQTRRSILKIFTSCSM